MGMTQEARSRAFAGRHRSAKLCGFYRRAGVALGNVDATDDVRLLARVCDEEPGEMLLEHVVQALARAGERCLAR
jgi:hypothetical protein